MQVMLAVRFLSELGMLACLAWGGWELGPDGLGRIVLAVGLPALAATVWAIWVAPRAERRLADPRRLSVEVALYTAALLVVAWTQQQAAISLGIAVWAAFVLTGAARGHEPTPPSR